MVGITMKPKPSHSNTTTTKSTPNKSGVGRDGSPFKRDTCCEICTGNINLFKISFLCTYMALDQNRTFHCVLVSHFLYMKEF